MFHNISADALFATFNKPRHLGENVFLDFAVSFYRI